MTFKMAAERSSRPLLVAMSLLMALVLVVSAPDLETMSKARISTFTLQESEPLIPVAKWRPRRALQADSSMRDRPAPRSYPPPQGNALNNHPRYAPPRRPSYDKFNDENAQPGFRTPSGPRGPLPPPRH